MKKIVISIILSLTLCLSGCFSMMGVFGKPVAKGNSGEIEQKETNKSKSSGNIKGRIKLPAQPIYSRDGRTVENQTVRIDGIETSFPAGSEGIIDLNGDGDVSTYSINALLTSWKLNSSTTGLVFFGAVMVAGGVVLVYFGFFGMGVAGILGGLSIIACAVLVDKYPFVLLAVAIVGLLVGVYFIYTYIKKNSLSEIKNDALLVIKKIAMEIDKLPSEIQEQIKDNLKKDDNSSIIKQIITQAKNL